ncbi:MAG: metallophosphoesterase [Bacteroidetes bacterium]|nr:metallophosphoesterase [Bacteroidota bacterium]
MKIQYCSDLHLEFPENQRYLKENPIEPLGDILILAGDILPFTLNHKEFEFFDFVSERYEIVYWLPGNHEYYHSDVASYGNYQYRKIRKNVLIVDNIKIEVGEINLIFSTLWSKINPENEFHVMRSVSDFHVIRYNGKRLLPEHFNALHERSLEFLAISNDEKQGEKTIMVTHHVPTLINYPEQHKNSPLNDAFTVELFDFIEQCNFDYWIYGHHHVNIGDFEIGKTKLLTNQLGYVKYNEQKNFSAHKIIEL